MIKRKPMELKYNQPEYKGTFMAVLPLVLASGSPRRKDLLESMGLEFTIDPCSVDEPAPNAGEKPSTYAARMAELKSSDAAQRHPGKVIIGADTVVTLDGRILSKPKDADEAVEMLTMLAGRTHQVATACCLTLPEGETVSFTVHSEVTMRISRPATLKAYARSGESLDKAGGYAIQGMGAFIIEKINGSYTSVVGLPLAELAEALVSRRIIVSREG